MGFQERRRVASVPVNHTEGCVSSSVVSRKEGVTSLTEF